MHMIYCKNWLKKIGILVFVVLEIYFLLRVEFFIWNRNQFENSSLIDIFWALVHGFRFDISAVVALTSPLILMSVIPVASRYEKKMDRLLIGYFVLVHLPFILMNGVDVELVNFVGRRSTLDGLFLFREAQGKWSAVLTVYWPLALITFFQFAFFPWLIHWSLESFGKAKNLSSWSFRSFGKNLFVYLMVIVFSVIAIRGGLQRKPINMSNAQLFNRPILNSFVLNTSFAFIKSYGAQKIENIEFFSDEESLFRNLNGNVKSQTSVLDRKRISSKQNVFIIILESFALEYMGEVNGDHNYTPFLDSLAKKGLFFTNAFANARRSIEGIPAVLGSIPALMDEPFVTSSFVSNQFRGIGQILDEQGYYTAFFHGGMNGTMYFDSFSAVAGFRHYFGAHEYPNKQDHDGTWGIYDEPFFQFALNQVDDEIKKSKRNFLASIFSLSSHHPYRVPDQYKNTFPKGPLEILETISYTDYALKKFFESASEKSWFKDTLFVITADHAVKHFRKNYENELGDYRIPIIFYHPQYKWPKLDTKKVAQQIDILPSIIDFLGLEEKKKNLLASSLFSSGEKTATLFIENKYMLVGKDHYLRFVMGQNNPVLLKPDGQEVPNSLKSEPEKNFLFERLKASIQYFNQGMLKNQICR